jgi:chromosome segregation ATPase
MVVGGLGIALMVGLGSLAWLNYQSASDWRDRATARDAQIRSLTAVLNTRTTDLAQRTQALNEAAANLKTAEHRLNRSEGDVKALATRQRQLAAEKAHVEDQRASLQSQTTDLESIATEYATCSSGLNDLLTAVSQGNYTYAVNNLNAVYAGCDSAASDLGNYQQQFG